MKPPVKPKYSTATPYIAAHVILRRNDKIAFVLRQNTQWMNGHYGLPSGKVELDESFTVCAMREAKEETGVVIHSQDLRFVLAAHRNDPDSNDAHHWFDICFEAEQWEGEPYNAEPHIHGELMWFSLDKLPDNTVPYVRFYIEQIAAGNHYAEYGWE